MTLTRRDFLRFATALPLSGTIGSVAFASPVGGSRNLLILVELKGGNDALNTVVPYADGTYRRLRSRLALDRDTVLKLTDATGLHPSLDKLLPLWEAKHAGLLDPLGGSRAEPRYWVPAHVVH